MYSKFASSANEEENCAESRKLCMTLPPIPLERPEQMKLEDGNYVSFKLRAVWCPCDMAKTFSTTHF
jgi:hypothetical protein